MEVTRLDMTGSKVQRNYTALQTSLHKLHLKARVDLILNITLHYDVRTFCVSHPALAEIIDV